jgi:ADP-heptose:LPS heptosyltransferase
MTLTFVSPAGAWLALMADRLKLSPNFVSVLCLLVGVVFTALAAFCLSPGWPLWVILLLTLYFSYALDCADGMLARGKKRGTPFGGIFDKVIDAVSVTTLPILLGYAAWSMPSAWSEKQKLLIIFLSAGPRTWFSVLNWVKDNIRGSFKRDKEDKPNTDRATLARRLVGNSIDEITWRLGHWIGLVTGFYWETALGFSILYAIILPLYVLQTWHQHTFNNMEYVPLSLSKRLGSLGLGLIATALRFFNRLTIKPQPGAIIIEPFGLGDVVTLRPLLSELCQSDWNQPITVCIAPKWFGALSDLEKVKLIKCSAPWAAYSQKSKYRLSHYFSREFREWIRSVRKQTKGQLGVDTRGDVRSLLLLYLFGCSDIISLSSYLSTDMRTGAWSARHIDFDLNVQRWELNTRFYQFITGLEPPLFTPPSFPAAKTRQKSHTIKKIGLITCSPWAGKLWPSSHWQKVIEHFTKKDYETTGFAGPGQKAETQSFLGSEISVLECTSIEEWITQLSKCDLFLSADTGPAHIAAALDIPIVSLNGASPLPLWSLPGKWSRTLERQKESGWTPVSYNDSTLDICSQSMARITAEDAQNAIMALIQEYESAMASSESAPV